MIKPQNKIIIVDNNPDHLAILSTPFHINGIGCRACHYDVMYENPISGVRIAFFDINLNDTSNPESNESQIFSTLADAIRAYISLDNEPFALVFWTSNKSLIENFKIYVQARRELLNIPTPFLVTHIDKDEFINSGKNLSEKILEILNNDSINLLLDFENRAAYAAELTINEIYKTIPANDIWGNSLSFEKSFDQIFSKIAQSTLGLNVAKENPTKAVYSALIPMLNYYLSNNSAKTWDTQLLSLNQATNSKDLKFPDNFNFRKLNSVFHLQQNLESNTNKGIRGVALGFNIQAKSKWCSFISKYFADLEKESRKYFELFIQFENDKSTEADREYIRNSSRFFLLEISAACDYSQNKKRLNKYMLGMISPIFSSEYERQKSDFIFFAPEMHLDGSDVQIRLNYNFVYGLDTEDKILAEPLFRFKGEILDQISTLHSNHIARIGITSFN